tara:strand:+ start:256 stop:807 length:552 start_codon:yes stop_codon:yes gene_type:complete
MKDFLYIKPPKTATTAVQYALQPHTLYNSKNGISITGHTEDIRHHLTYLQYLKILGLEKIKNAIILGTIRNPWDRCVSAWLFSTKQSQKTFKNFLLSYNDFQYNYFVGADNVNYIKVENLQQDFDIVCGKIGIPQQEVTIKNKGPRRFRQNKKDYTEYYNNETKEIVAKKHAKDIEYFGYEFK